MWLQGKVAAWRVEQNNGGVGLDIAHVQSSVPASLQKYSGFGVNWMWAGLGAEGWVFGFVDRGYCVGGICSRCLCTHGP